MKCKSRNDHVDLIIRGICSSEKAMCNLSWIEHVPSYSNPADAVSREIAEMYQNTPGSRVDFLSLGTLQGRSVFLQLQFRGKARGCEQTVRSLRSKRKSASADLHFFKSSVHTGFGAVCEQRNKRIKIRLLPVLVVFSFPGFAFCGSGKTNEQKQITNLMQLFQHC